MMRALMISATGMTAQQMAMDNISNNLANVNTTGFKTTQVKFSDIFYQKIDDVENVNAPNQAQSTVGVGVRNAEIARQFTQGTIENTGGQLDLAVQGDGFFQVLRPDGTMAYTRDGSFKLSSEGLICTSQGNPLVPQIEVPNDAVEVVLTGDGTVSIKRLQDMVPQAVAQLELSRFINPGSLTSLGQNLYAVSESSGEPIVNTPGQDGLGSVIQGGLERSNVNLVNEMVNMIMTQRAYEMNTKSIQASDEMMKMANNLRRV